MLGPPIEIPLCDRDGEVPVPSHSLGSGDHRGKSEVGWRDDGSPGKGADSRGPGFHSQGQQGSSQTICNSSFMGSDSLF